MTKREKKIILRIVDELMKDDGNFAWAIDTLLHFIGGCYPKAHVYPKKITIREIIQAHSPSAGVKEK